MTKEAKQRDKPEMVRKIFRAKIKGVDKEKFIVYAVVSDDSMDRYKESILPSAYEKRLPTYKQHPILLSSHQYDKLTYQIGLADDVYIEDNKLHANFRYFVGEGNVEADWGFKLAEKGIAAFSVGFIPHGFQDPPAPESEDAKAWPEGVRRRYTDVELLEISQVLVPANPNALQNSLKSESDPVMKSIIEQVMHTDIIDSYVDAEKRLLLQKKSVVEKKLEETENEFRYRVKEPELFMTDSFRQKTIKEDKPRVHAIFGKLKDGDETMVLQALRFPKEDGWTMTTAGKWAEDHTKDLKNLTVDIVKGFISYETYPMMGMEAEWDEGVAISNVAKWASSDGSGDNSKIDWDKFRKAFTWEGSQKDSIANYKFPHHDIVQGNMMTNWSGVVNAMALFLEIKQEMTLSDEDGQNIYGHLAEHYKEANQEPPEMKKYESVSDVWSGCNDSKTFISLMAKIAEGAFIKLVFAESSLSFLRDKETQIETRLSSLVLKQTDSLVKKTIELVEQKMKNISPDKIEINLSEYVPAQSNTDKKQKEIKEVDEVIKKIQQMFPMFPEISDASSQEKNKGLDEHMQKILGSIQDVNSSLTVKSK